MTLTKYPKDLAAAVYSELKNKTLVPSLDILVELFETMYFASIKTEESEPIIFNIAYIDQSNPDPNQPTINGYDRWKIIKFRDTIQFNAPNIIKLAKASDPRSSSIAIYLDNNNKISIWGLIDQGNRYHDYINYEAEARPDRPGVFQASLEGPGIIVAYSNNKKIAELRVNNIVRNAINIFQKGPIKDNLQVGLNQYLDCIKKKLDSTINVDDDFDDELIKYWFRAICRIILRIKSYRHGGAILITDDTENSDLDIKYPIIYERLSLALINRSINFVKDIFFSSKISDLTCNNCDIPKKLYLEESECKNNLKGINSEIDGCLWFISLLSRVDGLIVLNKNLVVRGFGVEIKTDAGRDFGAEIKTDAELDKIKIYNCNDTDPTKKNSLEEIDYNHFGTRHRSMIRYCWKYENALGFVISQDGDVRAITKHDGKLLIWDNIKLQEHSFVRRLKKFK